MNLQDMIYRNPTPIPWAEGEKIPWNEPGFSARMLKEHLNQSHDNASRRSDTIAQHTRWIHDWVLDGKPARILDLGCGPGLYTCRLAQLGHCCVGIDFSPASIAYAAANAVDLGHEDRLQCSYHLEDIRSAKFGRDFDLVMFIFGELNVFNPLDTRAILHKAYEALAPSGKLLLEVNSYQAVEKIGKCGSSWYSTRSGLFSERPHLCMMESFWDAAQKVATERYFILDAATGMVTRYASSTQAYTQEEYYQLLVETGFTEVYFCDSLSGSHLCPPGSSIPEGEAGYFVILANRAKNDR